MNIAPHVLLAFVASAFPAQAQMGTLRPKAVICDWEKKPPKCEDIPADTLRKDLLESSTIIILRNVTKDKASSALDAAGAKLD